MSQSLNGDNRTMEADFNLGEDGSLDELPEGFRRGFYRPEGGRRPGYSPRKAKELQDRIASGEDDGVDDTDEEAANLSASARTALAKARKETALAGLNELQLKVKSGEYLSRAAYQEATATLLAMLSQGLRSLPDTLERKCNLPPDALELVEQIIDEGLNEVAQTLALFTEAKP